MENKEPNFFKQRKTKIKKIVKEYKTATRREIILSLGFLVQP